MRKPKTLYAFVAGFLLLGISVSAPIRADELKLDAEALFARGVTSRLCLTMEHDAIQLQRGVLYEDDGPAAGYSYLPNSEKLDSGVWIKKQLIIPAHQAKQATLLVGRGGELVARVNGKPVQLDSIDKQGNYWQAYHFPPSALRTGTNEFVLNGTGSVWIARHDEYAAGSLTRQMHPNRSAKSLDRGKTWNDKQLGTDNNVDGEYYVRLFLDQYQPEGKLILGPIDVGNLAEKPIGPPVKSIGPIHIHAAANQSASIQIRQRTGTTFVPNENTWSKWSTIELEDSVIANPLGRYLQLELAFKTDDPLRTPTLTSLTISTSPQRPADWTKDLQTVKLDNPPIVRSSIPFQYEPFDRPELAKLRRDHKLDDVVAGAKSEFELIQRLAAWSATCWQRMHLKESYPAYNALEILEPHKDGTPVGGFCQQYNVVFLQACESFGLVGRLVSIGPGNLTDKIRSGHETVEIWSNEYGKWVYIDGNTAWYAIDQQSKQPLSLLELHKRQLTAFRGEAHRPIEVVKVAPTKHDWPDLNHWPPLVELRLIPRSNFLQEKSPLPLNQGMRGWFWTGHYVWTDDLEPARLLYSNRIAKRDNFEWTLNQAHLVFEATEPGILRTHVDSQTPGFKQFLRQTGDATIATPAIFDWSLGSGQNDLQIVPQNHAGRIGIATTVELSFSRTRDDE